MDIHFTARKFRARNELKRHTHDAIKKLDRFYDGIVRADVILSFERSVQSVKVAEINLYVHGTILSARESSEEFAKSVDFAIGKLERRLSKYKTKLRMKDKKTLRRVKQDGVSVTAGEEE
jgi:putative sigma-54 modulation protein